MSLWTTLDRLFQAGVKTPVALAATAACSVKSGDKRRFHIDSAGRWVNRQKAASFVSHTVHSVRYSDLRQNVLEHWCEQYRPGPNDVVLDIGAGIGEETVVFSHLAARVISIEAHPDTFNAFTETVRRSGLQNVTPVNCAITDKDGTVFISDQPEHLANSVVGGGNIPIPARSLSSLCTEFGIGHIDFLKMNIEGAELLAVQGLGDLSISNMAISCHDFIADAGGPDSYRTKAGVSAFLSAKGYSVSERKERKNPWDAGLLYVR
jgi:FkbM family methyltransferase